MSHAFIYFWTHDILHHHLIQHGPMMHEYRTKFAILLLGTATSLSSCHQMKEPDPCAGQVPLSAKFSIKEQVGVAQIKQVRTFSVDTIGCSSYTPIVFTAQDSTATSYEWTVGQDARIFTQRQFSLSFTQAQGAISVRLRVTKRPNTCFPDDNGMAVSQQTLVVLPEESRPIYGDYEGYNISNPNRRFTVKIGRNSLLNLPEGCIYDLRDELSIGSTAFYAYSNVFDPAYGAASLNGWGKLDSLNNHRIVIEYSYRDSKNLISKSRQNDTFIGYRK